MSKDIPDEVIWLVERDHGRAEKLAVDGQPLDPADLFPASAKRLERDLSDQARPRLEDGRQGWHAHGAAAALSALLEEIRSGAFTS